MITSNGAGWLGRNHRDWLDAEFAINGGAWGELDAQGNRVSMNVQAGEKTSQNYRLEVTNPGGHSSRPRKDNAIYQLARALSRVEAYEFPAQFTDASRAYFSGMAKIQAAMGNADIAAAMNALVKDPNDAKSIAEVSAKM
jgi:acetylornithine deacetylase/succinyl-diaminopimelate desuccinylase-like protein